MIITVLDNSLHSFYNRNRLGTMYNYYYYYYTDFTDEETQEQRGKATCLETKVNVIPEIVSLTLSLIWEPRHK